MQERIDRLRALGYVDGVAADDEEEVGVLFRDPKRSCPGYDLYCVQKLSRADLIDEQGVIIRTWQYEGGRAWARCELLKNGDLLVVGQDQGAQTNLITDAARYLMRFDWNGRLLWKRQLHVHHDVEVTPEGNLLALCQERRLMPEIDASVEVRDDRIVLLSSEGEVLESRSMLDAIVKPSSGFPLSRVQPTPRVEGPWIDILHLNSLEWIRHESLLDVQPLYGPNNILVCSRHQDRIAIINWDRNEVVWQWGQGEIFGPHDAQVLETGNILLFDNGLGRQPAYSRVLELNPVTEEVVWEYRADPPESFYTASKGSVQRLPNGNTLLAESDRGRAIEVTPEGDVVWEFICPHRIGKGKRAAIVRMKRFPKSYIEAIE